MASLQYIPEPLDIIVVEGNFGSPSSFVIQDSNGDNISDYEPSLTIYKELDREILKVLSLGQGLVKTGAVTMLQFATDVDAGKRKHYIDVMLAGQWKFTVLAGTYWISKPGDKIGIKSSIYQATCKLPVLPFQGGGFVLLDAFGNPILDAQGNPITTN